MACKWCSMPGAQNPTCSARSFMQPAAPLCQVVYGRRGPADTPPVSWPAAARAVRVQFTDSHAGQPAAASSVRLRGHCSCLALGCPTCSAHCRPVLAATTARATTSSELTCCSYTRTTCLSGALRRPGLTPAPGPSKHAAARSPAPSDARSFCGPLRHAPAALELPRGARSSRAVSSGHTRRYNGRLLNASKALSKNCRSSRRLYWYTSRSCAP
jgi:hypothetical protein